MKAVTTAGLVVLIGVAACAWIFVQSRSELLTEHDAIARELKDLEDAISRRAELVPGLSAALRGDLPENKPEDSGVFAALERARLAVGSAQSPQAKFDANNQLSAALGRLFVAVEVTPKAKANERFQQLQRELEGTDNRILQARRRYNDALKRYNTDLARTPGNLVGSLCGLQRENAYFKTEPVALAAPKVQF